SFTLRIEDKRDALADIRERFLILKHKLDESDATQRLARQIMGKLDLAIAAVDDQNKALAAVGSDGKTLPDAANVITRSDGYNITSTEPLLTMMMSLIETVEAPQMKRSVAALAGLLEANGLGTSHIHLRINALQLNNAFRA